MFQKYSQPLFSFPLNKVGVSDLLSDGSGHLPALPPVRDKGARKYTDSMQGLLKNLKSYNSVNLEELPVDPM